MSEQDKGECRVCGAETSWLCPLCKEIWYCGRDHQKSDWKQHKQSCKEHQRKTERSTKAKEDNIFHAGDRVVLRGLKNASHMNQRHGRVVSEIDTNGCYKVILDLMSDPDVNPRVLPVNLRHCEKVINIETQAGTENGLLEKESGMAVFGILDVLRMCAYYYVEGGPQVESTNEIAEMRENNEDGTFVNMAAAWDYWNIKTPGRSKTIYNFAKELVQHNNIHNSVRNDPLQHRARLIITEAMDKKVACKSWHLRIHGVFWIIDVHKDGTYLVPEDKNQDYLKVYQALGVGDTLWSLVCNSGNNGNAFRGVITVSTVMRQYIISLSIFVDNLFALIRHFA